MHTLQLLYSGVTLIREKKTVRLRNPLVHAIATIKMQHLFDISEYTLRASYKSLEGLIFCNHLNNLQRSIWFKLPSIREII